jgi:hypothetical protein
MEYIEKLAFKLLKASRKKDVQKCIKISEKITKVLETYKTCCWTQKKSSVLFRKKIHKYIV